MRNIPTIADFFVVASGTSTTHVGAIADHIIKKMKGRKSRPWHIEGVNEALWILLDYGDVVAHIFYDETRRFYCLERLWQDAPQERFKEEPPKRKVSHAKRRRRT